MTIMTKSSFRFTLLAIAALLVIGSPRAYCESSPEDVARVAADGGIDSSGGATATAVPDLFTGAMSYRIPIEVPPGINGLEPNLALLYRSSNGNGWLGMGWELELGSIERTTLGGVDYSNDSYILRSTGAASELVPVTSSEFRSKIEKDFTKITKVNDAKYFHDYYFIATSKLGIKFYFGQTEDSSVYGPQGVFKWALNRVEDTYGNVVDFTYVKHSGQIYLSQIDYNGNLIKFYLEDRPDKHETFTTNFPISTTKRLQYIDVFGADGSRLRAYYLNYEISFSTGRSKLESVKKFGKEGITDSLSIGTSLVYTYANKRFNPRTLWLGGNDGPNGTQTYNTDGYQYTADFNGDGMIDLMYLAADGWYIAKSNGNGFGAPTLWLGVNGPTSQTYKAHYQYTGDFTGDGKVDYMYSAPDGWYVAKSNGSSFDPPTRWLDINGPNGPTSSGVYTFQHAGDFTGDGKVDYMYLGSDGWYIAESTGNGFKLPVRWLNDVIPGTYDLTYSGDQSLADFNGDGKIDYMYNRNGWHVALSNGSSFDMPTLWLSYNWPIGSAPTLARKIGDFNGDGKTDFMYLSDYSNGQWYVALSNGNGFQTPAPWLGVNGPSGPTYTPNSIAGDFNGDAKADYIYSNGGWYVALSNGAGFETPTLWLEDSPIYSKFFGDFTGDGKIDYMSRNSVGWTVANNDGPADLLAQMSNDLGATTYATYKASTQYSNTLLPFSVQTLSSLRTVTATAKDGVLISSTTSFSYSGGYFHVKDRDFRGFNHVTVTGPAGQNGERQITETWFHQGNDINVDINNPDDTTGYMKGKPYRVRTSDGANKTYSETETAYAADKDSAAPWFNPPAQVDTYVCDGNVVGACKGSPYVKHIKTEYQFDSEPGATEYGNMTFEIRHGDVNITSDDLTLYKTYSPNPSKWIVGLQTGDMAYKGIGTSTPIASTIYYYDGVSSCDSASQNQTPDKGKITRTLRWLKFDDSGRYVEERMAYDVFGNLVCRRDARGNTTTIAYDASNTFPVTMTSPPVTGQPQGFRTTTQYYGVNGVPSDKGLYGQVKSVVDPNEQITTTEYDTLGRKRKTINPDETWTEWQYSDFGSANLLKVKTISSNGVWKESYLDGFMRAVKNISKGPSSSRPYIQSDTTYDSRGNVVSRTTPTYPQDYAKASTHPFAYAYDSQGRVTRVTSPENTATSTCYDRDVTVTVDPNGHRRREVRDVYGRLLKVQEYEGRFSSCSTEEGTPYASTVYVYDALGNLIAVFDAKLNMTRILYDTLGRKRHMYDPDMGMWTYDYDDNGNLTFQTDAKQNTITFVYDELNRLTTKKYPSGPDVVMVYDEPTSSNSKGRLTKMTDSSGQTLYGYDPAGRVISTTKTIDVTSFNLAFGYVDGRLDSITYPDNEIVHHGYDDAGNLGSVGSYIVYEEFDSLGRPERVSYGNNVNATYGYDSLTKRLTDLKVTSPTQEVLVDNGYGYDDKGNITSITDRLNRPLPTNFVGDTYTPVRAHAIGSTGSGRIFQYDNNGNITNDGLRAIVYDYNNMPTSIGSTTFTYDGNGTRVKKSTSNVNTVYFDKLFECTNGVCVKYIFAGNNRIALKSNNQTLYYHSDHLGSTSVVTDDQGYKVEEIAYYSFGETRQEDGSVAVNHMYTGQEWDSETNLYNYNARIYDPSLGRFLTPDTIVPNPEDPQSLNRYAYARNNPILYSDPTGHWFFFDDLVAAVVGAVVGGISAAIQGGDIWQGIGVGAVAGWVGYNTFGAAAGGISHWGLAGGVGPPTQGMITAGQIGGSIFGGAASGATAGGMNAAINGGNVGDGMLLGAGYGAATGAIVGVLNTMASYTRSRMIEQSRINSRNASGKSYGLNGDGFKVGGGRWTEGVTPEEQSVSFLGGQQGGKGSLFGIEYSPGSIGDFIVEVYAGPHDYLNSRYWYNNNGNAINHQGVARFFGEALNFANVFVATPFAAASVTPPYVISPAIIDYGGRR
ncbi:RHS repeat-associated core domain-containing protein [Geobacter sulfurreducens subsp. ethanolicus]|uniref:RHS repeat-associated core domain-containing protein n=1 Tax=Geobacter sulfurreducens TaxID=35554 RepID=UPI0025723246|nr:RHS repeat-associated core domain-containing protein [Geobacter sulfurreducens]BEH09273.1 RHS repeat-associated core domain-containing protein [Geobacter sulfurreducens subsp. ethanolicus]